MKNFISLLVGCLVLLVLSCDKPNDPPPAPPPVPVDTVIHVKSISVDPSGFLLIPSLTRKLSATLVPADADNKGVSWATSDSAVATVAADGLVTALKEGTATITVISKENKSITATATLIVLKDYDVYAVGTGRGFGYTSCAFYWKNGTPSLLPGGTTPGADAYAILFSGNDEYIAGNTINANRWGVATYWKNGVAHVLGPTNIDNQCRGKAIAVEGDKVVVAGYTFYYTECPSYCTGRSRAFYWTDSAGTVTETALNNFVSSTQASGVAFKDGNVLIAGSRANDNRKHWATCWRNDTASQSVLSPVDGYYQTTAIKVNGADVYFTGYGGCSDIGCKATAFVWKNDAGNATRLTDGLKDAQAHCIAFSGNTIYIGGYEKNEAGKNVARYWKIAGNTISTWAVSDGTKSSLVNGIAVSGNDLFLIGSELSDDGVNKAKCWRVYEGLTNPLSLDASNYYLPQGLQGNGIYIK